MAELLKTKISSDVILTSDEIELVKTLINSTGTKNVPLLVSVASDESAPYAVRLIANNILNGIDVTLLKSNISDIIGNSNDNTRIDSSNISDIIGNSNDNTRIDSSNISDYITQDKIDVRDRRLTTEADDYINQEDVKDRLDGEADDYINQDDVRDRRLTTVVDDKIKVGERQERLETEVNRKIISSGLLKDAVDELNVDTYIETVGNTVKRNAVTTAKSLARMALGYQIPTVMHGARAVLRLNDDIVGYANSINYTIDTEWTENWGIDDSYPVELVPGLIRVKGSFTVFRIPNNSPAQNFWQSDMMRMKIWPYSKIEVRDKRSDNIIAIFPRVAITSRSESITKGNLTTTTLSFISIGYRDELMPHLINKTGDTVQQGGAIDLAHTVAFEGET